MKNCLICLMVFMVSTSTLAEEKSRAAEMRAKRKKALRAILGKKSLSRSLVIKQDSSKKFRKKDNFQSQDIMMTNEDKRRIAEDRKKLELANKIQQRERLKAQMVKKRKAVLARLQMERRKILEEQKDKLIDAIKEDLINNQQTDAADSLRQIRMK